MDEDSYFDFWWDAPDTVGAIDTSGNSAFLGYQVGNPGSANPVPTSPAVADDYGAETNYGSGFVDSFGNAVGSVFDSITGALGSAAQNVLTNAGNAAVSGIVNAGNNAANQVAPRPNTPAPASGVPTSTVLLVAALAVGAVVLGVVLVRRK
jgi:hypothetical protein